MTRPCAIVAAVVLLSACQTPKSAIHERLNRFFDEIVFGGPLDSDVEQHKRIFWWNQPIRAKLTGVRSENYRSAVEAQLRRAAELTGLSMITVAAGLFALAACTSESSYNSYIGEGPLHLSPRTADHFEKYKGEFTPYYFAVTANGFRSNYIYCDNACRRTLAWSQVMSYCEANSNGVPCKIFAAGHTIVWRGPVIGLYNPETGSYDLSHGYNKATVEGVVSATAPLYLPSRPVTLIKCRFPDGFLDSMERERCLIVGGKPTQEGELKVSHRKVATENRAAASEPSTPPQEAQTAAVKSLTTEPDQDFRPSSCEPAIEGQSLRVDEFKKVITDYYKQHPLKKSRYHDQRTEIAAIEEAEVIERSDRVFTVMVKYRWQAGTGEFGSGTSRGIATVESCGSSYRVLAFE